MSPDVAAARSIPGMWVNDQDGNDIRMAGRGTIVSRRTADGTWRIVLDHPMRPD